MPALLFQTAVDTPLDIPLVSQMFTPVCALQEKVLALGIFKKKSFHQPQEAHSPKAGLVAQGQCMPFSYYQHSLLTSTRRKHFLSAGSTVSTCWSPQSCGALSSPSTVTAQRSPAPHTAAAMRTTTRRGKLASDFYFFVLFEQE